jgi:RNA polymerase sigma-70 factor, ECF subfamily
VTEVAFEPKSGNLIAGTSPEAGDEARAEKVTEDVLAEIWRTASCFDESQDSALSWIFSIARRQAASQSHAAGGDGRGPRDLAGTVTAVTRRAGPGLPAELIPGGPPTLTEVQRSAVLLACYGGYAQDQIADLLGIPATAVSAQIRDGLLRLGEPSSDVTLRRGRNGA